MKRCKGACSFAIQLVYNVALVNKTMTSIYQFRIEITDSEPPIWRRLQVDAEITFSELHDIIQIAFQTEFNSEEYEFLINQVKVFDFGAEIDTGQNPELKDSNDTFLDEYLTLTGTRFIYSCDSEDHAKYLIVLEKILSDAEDIDHPRCLDGEGTSPHADSAGFDVRVVNKLLQQYVEAWDEIYDEAEKIIGNEFFDENEVEDELWSEEDEPEYIDDDYECVKHFKKPEDVLKDELEKDDMVHWLEDNLNDEDTIEHKTWQRLLEDGFTEKKAKSLLLECLAIEWFSDLKYGTHHLDERCAYNMNRLPAKPLEIPNLDFAIQVLEKASKGIPFQAIEYLHDNNSPEATTAIIQALNNYSDHRYCWGNCQFAPIWFAIAAEGHLHEDMIAPVISLCENDDNETDWLLEQAEFLIGKLAMNYPELTATKVLDALEKDLEEGTDHHLFFLFDCFYFADISIYKERLLLLLKNTDASWHQPLVSTLSFLQVKEALPLLKQQLAALQKSDPTKNYIEYEEAIKELETGEILYPEVDTPICLRRKNTWREEFEPIEKGFYPGKYFFDDEDERFYNEPDDDFQMPWIPQQPVEVGAKVGRNDPCPCGSGKKYKKCCMS